MKQAGSDHRPSQVIVDLDAVRHNVQTLIENLNPKQEVYVAVKANAYGHGTVPVAKTVIEAGVSGLLVATVDEGIALRQACLQDIPILVMGLTDPRGIAEILYYNLIVTVSDLDFFEKAHQQLALSNQLYLIEEEAKQLLVHLALDTGMGRIGLRNRQQVEEFAKGIGTKYSWVNWQGVFTHFSTAAGGPQDYIDYQMDRWLDLLKAVPESVSCRHFANSGMGIWHNDRFQSDIIRAGISIYGIDPKDELGNPVVENLEPALELVSEIVYVKEVEAGSKISYGATYEASEREWIATIPIGYADGWLRAYHKIPVLIQGHVCPVVGVINMDQMMVRLPHYMPVGTTVTIIGHDNGAVNRVEELAHMAGTIGYEIITCLSNRLPRVYLNE